MCQACRGRVGGRYGEGRREKCRVSVCKEFGLPKGAWPSATAIAPVSLTHDSYTTCQHCMSVSMHIKTRNKTIFKASGSCVENNGEWNRVEK